MTLLRLLLVLCLATLATPALAAKKTVVAVPAADAGRDDLATLLLPEAIDGEMVDGREYPGLRGLLRRGDMAVRLLPGEREVALRYNQVFQTTASEHDVVKSKLLVLRFVAAPGQTYRVVHPQFRDARAAREGVQNLELRVEDASGENRVIGATQVSSNWKGEQTVTTRQDLVSPAAAAAVAPPAPAAAPAAGGLNALELLKFTWQNAGAADRAAFRDWIQANP